MITAVLNYPAGTVDIVNVPDRLGTTEEVEKFLEEVGGYRLKDIYYMTDAQINYRPEIGED